ncbi:MAG: NAD(P)/FAD-dependent oxidoreductase [Candidatus Melainabacteria bacterium]|nr:NAD(P)/FAD-dependent oxidoreductase [Candidatus Melainabacteria bacterium]
MASKKNIEVIVIGAGPAGLASAKVLADAGIETIVLEKETQPDSSSNFFSTVISQEPYENIFGKFIETGNLKIERAISEYRAYLLKEDSYVSLNNRTENKNSFSVLTKPFHKAISRMVEKAGATISYKTVARELITKDGKISGVKCDEGEYHANVVIVAEGVNSLLTKQAGLRAGSPTSDQVFLFAEENIALPPEVIEERLNLENEGGIAAKLFTHSFFKAPSIAYLHTNKDSISLATGVMLSESISKGININQYQENLKTHPIVKSLIMNGVTNHYSSFMLPVIYNSSQSNTRKLYTDGCLVIGGAATLVNPFSWDLSSLAILSGKLAAETIIKAKESGDYSTKALSYYEKTLKETIEYKELQKQKPSKLRSAFSFIKAENNLSLLLANKDSDISDTSALNNLSKVVLKGK